jgi:uncharacterized protein GlcG (DUF336 family)
MIRRSKSGTTIRFVAIGACLVTIVASFILTGPSYAWLGQSATPLINADSCSYDSISGQLAIRGQNFQKGATVTLRATAGLIGHGRVKVKSSSKIVVNGIAESDVAGGVDVTVNNPDGTASATVHVTLAATTAGGLTEDDVKTIIAQAVAQAEASGLKATIAVVDAEGNVLGVFAMNGAPANASITVPGRGARGGLEGMQVPSSLAAISKAVTGSFLSSQGHSFTSRTASFIVQQHFPPGVDFQAGGPLFGVQFSQLLVCSDINARSPLGLAADPGGIALYKNGIKAGGVGVEGDGSYSLDLDPTDNDQPVEELVAVAATRGFETPPEIQGNKIVVNGIRFTFVNTPMPAQLPTKSFAQLGGSVVVIPGLAPGIQGAQPSQFHVVTLDPSVPAGRVDNRFYPTRAGSGLTASDVQTILVQAARQAFITRAAIRQPENSAAEVNIAVVDIDGNVLGVFSTIDAPIFGFDVCVQKARTATFFSKATAGSELRSAGFARYVDAAAKDGLRLDGSVAFSDRAGGFLSRPFFPDGIDGSENGPFSVPIDSFSPFNDGLQLDLLLQAPGGAIGTFLRTGAFTPGNCTGILGIRNGTQIFPGSVPLFKNGKLVGGIGISGDGVDQDDLIAAMGSTGFESPADIRTDRVFVRGVRLPFVKFPRHPNR